MSAPVFVDTNVLIYAIDRGDPAKHRAAVEWRSELWKSRLGRTGFQVLQEFFAKVAQRALASRDDARAEVRDLLAWNPVLISAVTLERSWKLQDRYRISFWDALIVAAAMQASCGYLLTEDLQAGQDFGGLVVVNPFRTRPDVILA